MFYKCLRLWHFDICNQFSKKEHSLATTASYQNYPDNLLYTFQCETPCNTNQLLKILLLQMVSEGFEKKSLLNYTWKVLNSSSIITYYISSLCNIDRKPRNLFDTTYVRCLIRLWTRRKCTNHTILGYSCGLVQSGWI